MNCNRVEVKCYHCGHVFERDLDRYIKASSVESPECGGDMAVQGYEGEGLEMMLNSFFRDIR